MRPKQTGKKISTTKARQETEHFKETIISILEEITKMLSLVLKKGITI